MTKLLGLRYICFSLSKIEKMPCVLFTKPYAQNTISKLSISSVSSDLVSIPRGSKFIHFYFTDIDVIEFLSAQAKNVYCSSFVLEEALEIQNLK